MADGLELQTACWLPAALELIENLSCTTLSYAGLVSTRTVLTRPATTSKRQKASACQHGASYEFLSFPLQTASAAGEFSTTTISSLHVYCLTANTGEALDKLASQFQVADTALRQLSFN
jgi:hypothetical protein